jgi:hypothetical protein
MSEFLKGVRRVVWRTQAPDLAVGQGIVDLGEARKVEGLEIKLSRYKK